MAKGAPLRVGQCEAGRGTMKKGRKILRDEPKVRGRRVYWKWPTLAARVVAIGVLAVVVVVVVARTVLTRGELD